MNAKDHNGHTPDDTLASDSRPSREDLLKIHGDINAGIVRMAYELGRAHGLAEGLQQRVTDLEAKVNGS